MANTNPTLKDAVLGGQQKGATSPLGNFPEIAKMYAINPTVALSSGQVQAQSYNDQVSIANRKAAQEAEKERLANLANPNNYQQIAKKDGGYSFLDPEGKEISAYDYSRITGKDLGTLLAQSQNPIDIGFNQDWKNLQDYLNVKVASHNDDESLHTAQAIEQKVKDLYGVDLAKMDIAEVVKKFQQQYPTVFGYNQPGVQAGRTFLPSAAGGYGLGAGGSIGATQ